MSATIELRRVTKHFGLVAAVQDVSLTIYAGEFLTLLGPSGCGKTTVLRLIAGFDLPERGTVWLDGADVTQLPPYRRNVNQVFQSYALFPHLSVRDNVAFGLRMQRLPAPEIVARVAEAVALVSLAGLEDRKPHQLSGVSASAWPWPVHWRRGPRCSSSTSRYPRSTRVCGTRCNSS